MTPRTSAVVNVWGDVASIGSGTPLNTIRCSTMDADPSNPTRPTAYATSTPCNTAKGVSSAMFSPPDS
jgi:hypothetical protein